MAEGNQALLTPADDDFHPPDDSWWFHETCWFWFYIAERDLGGWLYNYIRPNIGISGGGCWVWDASGFVHWETPYYACHSALRLPDDRDLRDFVFPSGVEVQMREPLRSYRLGYRHDDHIELDLVFDAVMEPWVSAEADDAGTVRPHHFDQLGRVTGTLRLGDEALEVDCLAIRDRTWTRRSERWRHGGGYGYTNAAASPDHAFLAIATSDGAQGYLVRDGQRAGLVSGARRVVRHDDHGYITDVEIDAVDELGRQLHARGESRSRMAMPIPGVHGVVWTSLVEWWIDGDAAWGEDQEPWPIATWSRLRRNGHL